MDYELAKKLKDAGFPLKGKDFVVISDPNADDNGKTYPTFFEDPTLEELISACGEGFKNLSHGGEYYLPKPDMPWYANYDCNGETGEDSWDAQGETPSEAVSLLWLALHDK